jgi:hypothetical protein
MTGAVSTTATSYPQTYTYPPLTSRDLELHSPSSQMTYSTRVLTHAPASSQPSPSCSVTSNTTLQPHDSVSYIGSPKDKTSISHYSHYQAPIQTPPLPLQRLIIVPPPPIHNVLPLPPPGYVLWVPISQPTGLTFFRPSDTKPKEAGDIESSPVPGNWHSRTAIQREHWVEMTIFQKIPIVQKKHARWRCGLKKCKWTTKGGLWPTIATEYLVHQFEAHECWWSRTDEGRAHLNRLKRSLGV